MDLSGREYLENDAIYILLNSSKEFSSYYNEKRKIIERPIHWIHDIKLPRGVNAQCFVNTKGEQYIFLNRIPAELDDSMIVAHELQHLVLHYLGYPCLAFWDYHYADFVSSINSMVDDLLVDTELRKYGLDARRKYEAEQKILREQFSSRPQPIDYLQRLNWAFIYASNILDWEQVKSENENNRFFSWFKQRNPKVAILSKQIVQIVKKYDISFPSQAYQLYEEIIRTYNLERIMYIGYP